MRRSPWGDRLLVAGLVTLSLSILVGVGLAAWLSLRTKPVVTFQPRPITIQAGPEEQVLETECFAARLGSDFVVTPLFTCSLNAYARPRKYQYINVDTYADVLSSKQMEDQWRARWLTLSAELSDRQEVTWAGLPAIRFVERYPQNNEAFVTYLVFLDRELPSVSGKKIRAFELRGWGSTTADQLLVDNLVKNWQWRF